MLRLVRGGSLRPTITFSRAVWNRANQGTPSSANENEPVGHTGQKFGVDDKRQARFLHREKQVNPNFAIKLVNEVAPIQVDDNHVYCDGGHPSLGHPKVYINLDKGHDETCGYCGLRFIQRKH